MNAKCIKSKLTSGFSLIELMVVIAIVALLTAIAIPSYQGYLQQSKVSEIFSLASDQMSQWATNYTLGSFDYAFPTSGSGMGNYITSTEQCAGGTCGSPSNGGTAATGCSGVPNGTGSIGVVCVLLSGTANCSSSCTGAGTIDNSLSGVLVYFTPANTGTATGDTTDTSITWTCNFKSSTSSNSTTAASLLSPGNCTGI